MSLRSPACRRVLAPGPAAARHPARRRSAVLALAVVCGVVLVAPAGAQEPAAPAGGQERTVDPALLPPDGVLDIAVRDIRPFAFPTGRGWSGYSIEMWQEVARQLGVPYRFQQVATVDDQLEAVRTGGADAALGAISITAERAATLDFTQPMYDSGIQILVRRQGREHGLLGVLAALFSRTFLLIIAGVAVLLVIAGHVIWLVERRRNDDHFPHTYFAGVWEGIWWAMVTLATVGYGDRVARTRTGRVVSMLWMLVGLIVVAQVTAVITSTLTVDRMQNDVRNIGDLYGRPVATVRDTAAARYLEEIDLAARGEADVDEATDALLDGRVDAVVYDSPILKYFARTTGRDRSEVVGPLYRPQGYGMVFPPGSPLVQVLDPAFLALREDGTAASLEERYLGPG